MTKRKIIPVALCICLVLAMLAGCGGGADDGTAAPADDGQQAGQTEQKVFHLIHTDPGVPESPYEMYAKYFTENLEKLSNGAWTVEVTPGSQYGTEPEEILSLSMGEIDGSFISCISYSNVCPDMYWSLLPYCVRSYEEANMVLNDPGVTGLIAKSMLRDGNVVVGGFGHMGLRHLMFAKDTFSAKPAVDEIAGKKIRVTETPITVGVFKALGAVPTAMNTNEMVTALQQGTVDGLTYSYAPANSAKLQDMLKCILLTNHYYVFAMGVFSADFWNTLTEEEKGWFKEASRLAGVSQRAEVEKMEKEVWIDRFEQAGCTTREVDVQTFIDKTRGAYDTFKKDIDSDLMAAIEKVLEKAR